MESAELKAALKVIKDKIRVTKVVCTRSVKGKFGDVYVGFSAAWDTVQDDAGGAADLISVQDGVEMAAHTSGMTLKEARVASLILGMQADVAAHDQGMAGGTITPAQRDAAVRTINHNYVKLLAGALGVENGGE